RLYVFTQDNPAFVGKIQDSLRAANNVSYRHRLMTFQKKYRDAEMKWEPWGNLQCIQVGIRCIRAVLTSMEDCFELTKKQNGRNLAYYVDTTLAFDDFVIDETELRALSRPMNLPMIEAPIPYERVDGEVTGGYHTATLRRLSPFIKTRGPEHKAFVDAHFPYKHMTAVNSLQSTAWQANPAVVDAVTRIAADGLLPDHLPKAVATEIPPRPDTEDEERILQWKQDARRVYGRNKKNKVAMMQLRQNLEFLWEIGDDPFWFTYSCDFRGRLYCNSPLASMQGEDHLKAMIRFKEGKVMGERGLHWLAVHGANKYGYDKVPYADRVRWVHDHRDDIQEVVRFPTGSRALSFLRGADKPFQFLAFANEWADAGYGTDPSAVGYLPIGLDGSCNGLQHYAALLRDPRGGQAVNLVNGDTPSDIYGDVADALRARLAGITDDVATRFLAGGFDRKLTKRPVMTLPYGATQQSCRAYVREYIKDHAEKFGMHPDDDTAQWKLAVAITPHVWAAIGDVVVGGRQGMAWLQKCASMANKQ
ncbi:MAG: hypothetical protein GY900_12695, partial [Actinomycetia bacterium]|nr:hypothetical protein [Actinomycetes bacterium]